MTDAKAKWILIGAIVLIGALGVVYVFFPVVIVILLAVGGTGGMAALMMMFQEPKAERKAAVPGAATSLAVGAAVRPSSEAVAPGRESRTSRRSPSPFGRGAA